MLPYFRHPIHYLGQIRISCFIQDFRFHKLPAQISTEESLNGFHVICTEHPAEVVMKLEICCGAGRLVHCSNDVWAKRKRGEI